MRSDLEMSAAVYCTVLITDSGAKVNQTEFWRPNTSFVVDKNTSKNTDLFKIKADF